MVVLITILVSRDQMDFSMLVTDKTEQLSFEIQVLIAI